jgi:hypothetical protein
MQAAKLRALALNAGLCHPQGYSAAQFEIFIGHRAAELLREQRQRPHAFWLACLQAVVANRERKGAPAETGPLCGPPRHEFVRDGIGWN